MIQKRAVFSTASDCRLFLTIVCLAAVQLLIDGEASASDWVQVARDGKGFILSPSGKAFTPWGFNYDRDFKFRLIEEYWNTNWGKIEQDFAEMKKLGANVVRVHLQFAKFMKSADMPNDENLQRLGQLLNLAEKTGLYLDITGLGSYRKEDSPVWYDSMSEKDRWTAQSRFWEAIARTCADQPAVWCYDLMNEPLVSGDKQSEWIHPFTIENLHYLQYVNLDPAGRDRTDIARGWTHHMVQAIRKYDQRHLITIGLVMVAVGKPEEAAGFGPAKIGSELDFISVHFYPQAGSFGQWTDVLERCGWTGKPVVIEEIFPMNCSAEALGNFIERTRGLACGWIGFYWGQTPDELRLSQTPRDQATRGWLELFQRMNPNR